MIAFFGIITAVNAYMITKALETFPGEVSVTPYEDGIAFQNTLPCATALIPVRVLYTGANAAA